MEGPLILSALHETKSALILVELAEQQGFGAWEITPFGAENSGTVVLNTTRVSVHLQIGTREGVHLNEREGRGYTFKPTQGNLQIEIGKKLPETDAPKVAETLAETLAVFHTMCFDPTIQTARQST